MDGTSHFILYVADQVRSTRFYAAVLGAAPRLDVPGMSEFLLPGGAILGLMPESAIERLLGPELPRPSAAGGNPRAEIYLMLAEAAACHARALAAGAKELSPMQARTWGDVAAYSLDPDGHVLAFAIDGPAEAA
ncbi:MAG: VOC family protein [Burkholderiales bacterium]|jgi:predicted enzyme related to lactoylglutathione lyase|nr:VOC family protein [Burkholderiales bacterium]